MTTVYRNPAQASHPDHSDSPGHGHGGYLQPDTNLPPKARPTLDAVSVNGVGIPEVDILAEAQNHPAESPNEALAAAARALVVRELLSQEGKRLGILGEPVRNDAGRLEAPDDAAIRALIDREVSVPVASEAECRRYYENNAARFQSDPIYEARHILLAAPAGDESARKKAKVEAETLTSDLGKDPSNFAAMARRLSACPSKEQGGNLGQVTKGSTVPEFEAALEAMDEGEVRPEPVATRFGFHVLALDRKVAGSQLPFDVVKDRIAAWLEAASWSQAVSQYVGILAGHADIRGIDLKAANGPLVQ
ncbi:MAG: peptidylprolyl isomerase [Geminicoccaceae bacterium]